MRRRGSSSISQVNWYLAFAEWRADIQRSTDAWRTVKFFRQSRSHTILWTQVMRGHYLGRPPGVTECVAAMPCARMTARKILRLAQSKGYFRLRAAAEDSRRKLVEPSPRCVAEYEAMVDEFLHLADKLGAVHPAVVAVSPISPAGRRPRAKADRAKL